MTSEKETRELHTKKQSLQKLFDDVSATSQGIKQRKSNFMEFMLSLKNVGVASKVLNLVLKFCASETNGLSLSAAYNVER